MQQPANPGTVMFWIFTDKVIEDTSILQSQFHHLRAAGFAGLMAFVRASRYGLEDPLVIQAVKKASELCQEHQIKFWFTLDPRLPARYNNHNFEKGLTILFCGETVSAQQVPHLQPVENGRFNNRFQIKARPTHISQDVAITFMPQGIERVFAFPANLSSYSPEEVIDLTNQTRFFYNGRDNYIEAFGSFQPADDQKWSVVAFFKFDSTAYDFSNSQHFYNYIKLLNRYADSGIHLDALTWDEPGYYCVFGAYPYSNEIQKHFEADQLKFSENLWKFILPAADQSHIEFRNKYFSFLQTSVIQRHQEALQLSKQLWSEQLEGGIHYTWHFESADMADMNHGSMDLWRSLEFLESGFTDLGGINAQRNPDNPYYANLAAMLVTTQSLAKFSSGKKGYLNLWTVEQDDGSGYQNAIMNHCVNLMQVFSLRWLAHAYGPVGLIDEEGSFLGSGYCPGYPNHSTWKDFPTWNQRLLAGENEVGGQLPFANILVVFPVETLYGLGGPAANPISLNVFKLILWLLDRHYMIDLVSPSLMKSGYWDGSSFQLMDQQYDAIIYPYPQVIPSNLLMLLTTVPEKLIYGFCAPKCDTTGQPLDLKIANYFKDFNELQQLITNLSVKRPVQAPEKSWVSLIKLEEKTIISVAPARYNVAYSGNVSYQDQSVELKISKGLSRIQFQPGKAPEIIYSSER